MKYEIDVFMDALVITLSTMAGMEIAGKDYQQPQSATVYADVSTHIDLFGSEENARLVLTMSEKAAVKMGSETTGKEVISLINPVITDSLGEILNILVGAAQKNSSTKFDFSLPVVLKGKNHEVHSLSQNYEHCYNMHLIEDTDAYMSLFLAYMPEYESAYV